MIQSNVHVQKLRLQHNFKGGKDKDEGKAETDRQAGRQTDRQRGSRVVSSFMTRQCDGFCRYCHEHSLNRTGPLGFTNVNQDQLTAWLSTMSGNRRDCKTGDVSSEPE